MSPWLGQIRSTRWSRPSRASRAVFSVALRLLALARRMRCGKHVDAELLPGNLALVGVDSSRGNGTGSPVVWSPVAREAPSRAARDALAGLVADAAHAGESRSPSRCSRSRTLTTLMRSRASTAAGPRPNSATLVSMVAAARRAELSASVPSVVSVPISVDRAEDLLPGLQHLLGVVEPLLGVASQRPAEELGEVVRGGSGRTARRRWSLRIPPSPGRTCRRARRGGSPVAIW